MNLIAIEGPEGVGKSTQVELLKQVLPERFPNHEFVFTREPGGSPRAELIRNLILSDDMKDAGGKTMFGLFAAARHDHVETTIRPQLQAGKVVITDRFFGSSYAYQMCAQDDPIDKMLFGAHLAAVNMFPRLTIVLDMDVGASQQRVRNRTGDPENHFDSRGPEFHERLRQGYRRYAAEYEGYGVRIVNAGQSIEQVSADIMSLIEPMLL